MYVYAHTYIHARTHTNIYTYRLSKVLKSHMHCKILTEDAILWELLILIFTDEWSQGQN